ncbi:hypothetical protein [Agromyces archimandritae]|uniref:Uncharacterized protein n=1 Tax=Agromyces archimandritae TaxID=2781962 RepID=A0A975INM2_9MICO|nr:hypothetical protein [Agromyces archimandritae]QTX04748.1 hypothetical protein G127AT_00245 [Agromyces archimandritae]
MTDADAAVRTARSDARLAWTVGGGLLVAAVAIPPALAYALPGSGVVGAVCLAAAFLLFALGIRGAGSVSANRPLGTGALIALGVLVLARMILDPVLTEALVSSGQSGLVTALSLAGDLVALALALIASVQILRAGMLPAPWHRAPFIVVLGLAGLGLIEALLGAAGSALSAAPVLAAWMVGLDVLARTSAAVFLGVLAIVLADRLAAARPAPLVGGRAG